MEVLEQAVEHLQAQQGQQGENVLKFEARLERFLFQKMGHLKQIFNFFITKLCHMCRLVSGKLKSCLFCVYLLETGFISVQ